MLFQKTLYNTSIAPKTLCLTFDDGPGETMGNGPGPKTLSIAEFLYKEGISATFFVVGKFANMYPHILPQLIAFGHTIGNHTYDHPHLPDYFLQHGDVVEQIRKTDELLAPYVENKTILFRAPYQAWLPEIANLLNEYLKDSEYNHIGPIGSDIDSSDWHFWQQGMNEKKCADGLMKKILKEKSGIILMHDSTSIDDNIKSNNLTFETLKILIPKLKRKGYVFCKLNEVIFSEAKKESRKRSRILKLIEYGVLKYIWYHKLHKKLAT